MSGMATPTRAACRAPITSRRSSCVPGALPGERGQVGLDPAGPGLVARQRRGPVEAGEQLLVEQRRVLVRERAEVGAAGVFGVMAHQFDPGPADGGVVLLRDSRVAGGALDALADHVNGRVGAEAPDGEPGQMDVLAVSEAR